MKPNAARISTYLLPIDRFGTVGKVHSVFDQSLNLSVKDQLINLTASGEFLSSFGIQLSQETFRQFRPFCQQGNVVKLTEDSITVYDASGVKKVVFSEVLPVSLKVRAMVYEGRNLERLKRILLEEQLETRLGLVLGEKERAYSEFLRNPGQESCDWHELVTYFVGRGKGLTPSGDDLLMGYLFMLRSYEHPFLDKLTELLAAAQKRTTDVSGNYLAAMLSGYASSPFIALQQALQRESSEAELASVVEGLLAIGHTSGSDTCYGLLLGIEAVQNYKKELDANH